MQALEYRPWGAYEVLHDTSEAKVKIIEVEPGQRLSYQYHNKRREQWTVIYGTLTVVLDDQEYTVKTGGSIHIPLEAKHRAWNKTDKPVRFVEVQTGTYFGEDDIVRLEDDYMRADDVQEFLEMADEPGPWPEEYDKVNTIGGLTMPKENTNKLNKNE
jgi:mannose-6-phosphate isomerase